MRRHGIRAIMARPRRVRTTDSRHDLPIAPNLLERNFTAAAPNRVWLADITYVETDQGWLLSGHRHGPLQPQDCRLGDGGSLAGRTNIVRADNGGPTTTAGCRIDPSFRSRRARRIQAVVATPIVFTHDSNSSSASAGVFQPRVFLGLALRAAATAAIRSALWTLRSVPFGKY